MKMSTMKFVVAAACAMSASAAANADTITGRFTYDNLEQINITSPTLNGNVNTVKFNWTRQDAPGAGINASISTSFNTYCVDLAQTVSSGTNYTYNVVTPATHGFSLMQTTLLQRLWADYFPAIDTPDESAAFQMSVWEIIHDSTPNLGSGAFKINTAAPATTLATGWLGVVSSESYSRGSPLPEIVVLESSSAQDQITVVPAPATGALAGMGLLALASRRRKA